MRLVGLMSYYDERPSWLSGCIASYAEAGVSHLVAIDGAYALFPDAKARSSSGEADAIVETCNGLGIGLTLVRPREAWAGNEIEKRTALFRHGDAVAEPNIDWFVVIDADELVTRATACWLDELATTDLDTADVLLWERDDRDTPSRAQVDRIVARDPISRSPIRKVFRASAGIHCEKNHYTYVTPDGRELWSNRIHVPGLDLTEQVQIEHRTRYRSLHRHDQAQAYYRLRDEAGIEEQTGVTVHPRSGAVSMRSA